jgi:uncharacterized protein YraI
MIFARSSRRRSAIGVAVAIVAWVVAMLLPVPAQAARPNGYPVTNVNLRAGPGTDYPVIVTVPGRAPIAILGCLADYTWCDVVFQNARGWMRSIYLQGFYQGYYYGLRDYAPRLGYPVVAFDINAYWNSNYRKRPFYADRARWGAPRGEGWTNPAIFYSQLAPYGNWVWLQGNMSGCLTMSVRIGGPTLSAVGSIPTALDGCGPPTSRSAGPLIITAAVDSPTGSAGSGCRAAAGRRGGRQTTTSPGRRCRRPTTST